MRLFQFFSTIVQTVIVLGGLSFTANAQDLNGMATGNYAGVNGVSFNPAGIADSRFKFDLNLFNANSTFANNYLNVKNDAFVRRLFWKQPYASSFDAVKKDLLFPDEVPNERIFGSNRTNIMFPFSFMATTGKRSAIAITMNNRTVNAFDSMPVALAQSFFGELRDPSLYNRDIRTNGMQYNFLNWQEIGFTYSRVMLTTRHHMFKIGVTVKWMGANAGAVIRTDDAVVSFRDSNTLSLRSPRIQYARTERADIGQFRRRDILNNLEDQSFGWDAGFVYEFRARVKRFKYVNEDQETVNRRDLNKYMFRIGASLVDVGRFDLRKRPLTNDHSANIVNWDFSGVKANSLSEWDTAYAKKVNYFAGNSGTFSYRLPTALIANFDLHLFGGFYINAAAKAPFESFNKNADTWLRSNRWVAITPRFEGKFLGVYVPVTRVENATYLGATVRLGPVWFGSNNLAQLLSNPSNNAADVHLGLRLGFQYGKPSVLGRKITAWAEGGSANYATQRQLDSVRNELAYLKGRLDTAKAQPIRVSIYNNGVEGEVRDMKASDSIVIQNRVAQQYQRQQESTYRQIDQQTDSLLYELARKNLAAQSPQVSESKAKKSKRSKSRSNESIQVESSNEQLEKEVKRMRQQMQIQNAALIGGGAALAVASSGNKNDKKQVAQDAVLVPAVFPKEGVDSIRNMADTVRKASIRDTIRIRDTVYVEKGAAGAYKMVEQMAVDPVLFGNGSASLSETDRARIASLGTNVKQHPEWRIELTGMTDGTGSVEANRVMADRRSNAVREVLLSQGVGDQQIITKRKLAGTHSIQPPNNPKRVSIRVFTTQ